MNIQKSIRYFMYHNNLKQRDIARAAGMTQPYLSALMSGTHDPKISTVERIASALDVSVSEFIQRGE